MCRRGARAIQCSFADPDERQSVDIAFNRSALGPAFWKRSTVDLSVRGAAYLPSRHESCALVGGGCTVSLGADEAAIVVVTPATNSK